MRGEGQHAGRNSLPITKRDPVIDPALQKPLLKLHRAVDVKSFWKSVQRLFSASIANHSIGLLLRQDPNVPAIAKWTRSMPEDFFAAEPLNRCTTQSRRRKLLRLSSLFRSRGGFVKSSFYRHYMAAHRCDYGVTLFFYNAEAIEKEFGNYGLLEAKEIQEPAKHSESKPAQIFWQITCKKSN